MSQVQTTAVLYPGRARREARLNAERLSKSHGVTVIADTVNKAAKGLAGHFGKAAEAHKAMEEFHSKAMDSDQTNKAFHKAACAFHKSMGASCKAAGEAVSDDAGKAASGAELEKSAALMADGCLKAIRQATNEIVDENVVDGFFKRFDLRFDRGSELDLQSRAIAEHATLNKRQLTGMAAQSAGLFSE